MIVEYENRIEELRQRVAATDLVNQTVLAIRVRQSGYEFRVGQETILLKAIGLQLPEGQMDPEPEDSSHLQISLENLDVIDADALFVSVDTGFEDELALLQANPLYSTLPAVRNGKVFFVETGVWNSFDFIAAHVAMDEIERLLIEPAENGG